MVISARPDNPVHTESTDIADASVGALAARLSEQISHLVRDELALAELEMKQKAKRLGLGVGMFGASGMLALFGGLCAVAAAVLGVANVLSAWLSALVVGAGLFLLAGMLALAGRIGVKKATPPLPTDAVRSSKKDVALVREAVKR